MTRRQNRMLLVALLLFGVFSAGYLGIKAFNENLLYFYTPTDIANGKVPAGKVLELVVWFKKIASKGRI